MSDSLTLVLSALPALGSGQTLAIAASVVSGSPPLRGSSFYFFFFVLDLLGRAGAAFFRPADFFAVDFVATVALAMILKPL
jgi:hypothetical protein